MTLLSRYRELSKACLLMLQPVQSVYAQDAKRCVREQQSKLSTELVALEHHCWMT